MCCIINEKIKKVKMFLYPVTMATKVTTHSKYGNMQYFCLNYLLTAKLGFKVSVLGLYTNISRHNLKK